jgi:hypothetical protein
MKEGPIMSKFLVLWLGMMVAGGTAFAAEPQAPAGINTINGVVVDNACASGHKADIGEFVKSHTKECALMPNCEASGYSLATSDGQVQAFTQASNKKIGKFLKAKNATLNVTVKVKKSGSELELISIRNQG